MNSPRNPVIKFLLENGDNLNLLKALITFLPGRYGDSELFTEGIYSGMNIFQSYLDYLSSNIMMSNNHAKTSEGHYLPPPYYLSTLKWITTIRNLELFLEIFATKKSSTGKKIVIFLIEFIKAILRVHLLHKTNGNMLVHHSFYVPSKDVAEIFKRNRKPNHTKHSAFSVSNSNNNSNNNNNSEFRTGKRKTLSDQIMEQKRLEKQELDERNVLDQQQREDQQLEESTLIRLLPPSPPKDYNTKVVGELLYIFRPVIYWFLYCIFGKRSWKPWIVSFSLEFLSKSFSEYGLYTHKIPLTNLEQKELARRRTFFLFYLIRSPFYEKFIGDGFVLKLFNLFKKIPIFKTLVDILFNYLSVYRTRYFYTSAS
ncbi:hypothetical protein DICPUDRAFT_77414 [Dictyostelium purpureum]|uniref:Peroxisomal membrane protein PEX16 n=1 Tax=Dictyostelium purpureum TaxID=5786 RepID=F0ZGJ3_DICPU|nr:uncharacterized protein DICPUDRAFT_77414 [Dictyostelium purpureum]EGC36969.1 hypothetical protein DICPUDRAFT_77414 [Dictyostelium purpureum]|eukprot:XP_003286537.1 hypothetical protein DICPUDRAFT_77414 [Dictyostelium purpureum]